MRGQDLRGSARDRHRRRRWLLSPEAGFGGDSKTVPCAWCEEPLTYTTMQVDRWPLCGHAGGRYVRKNIIPSCGPCNKKRCQVGRDRDDHVNPLDKPPGMRNNGAKHEGEEVHRDSKGRVLPDLP